MEGQEEQEKIAAFMEIADKPADKAREFLQVIVSLLHLHLPWKNAKLCCPMRYAPLLLGFAFAFAYLGGRTGVKACQNGSKPTHAMSRLPQNSMSRTRAI